ncbi:MAG TPA: type VI secretion system accessory protein TagJ [Ottowia sp.]|uniref:type VI secretion system accessory protein TagJ n=1 Tax=Ottowia sp. TaxID=1898956 RepID=UPI002BF06334|nr:type VI secretion system accessory protein TagJ [Ottowia sp.]HMN20131.1 type VI secretion system accessory protein TagJ [Ottowia sp.]
MTPSSMSPADWLHEARPDQALSALTEQVRAQPGDSRLRVFMAQLLCVLGRWERALTQLDVAAELDALALPMKQVYGDAIRCEGLRAEVFAGRRTPLVLGEPPAWLAPLIESLRLAGSGQPAQAEALRQRAFDAAPALTGRLEGTQGSEAFAWIADADMRLGPVLEAFINGRYYWVPCERLARVRLDPPEDLRDAVWMPAHLDLRPEGETLALIPARYPGSEAEADGALALARRTEWREAAPGVWHGLGQRVLATDQGEHALLDLRDIVLDAPASPEPTTDA